MSEISTKPYLLRAIYEWCTDNGFTPYLSVKVNGAVQVPMEFVRKGEIVLNVSFGATSGLKIDNDAVKFKARFGGVSREIYVPIFNVQAIFASENGQGMVFDEVNFSEPSEIDAEIAEPSSKPSLGLAAVATHESSAPNRPEGVEEERASYDSAAEPQKKFEKPSLKIIK